MSQSHERRKRRADKEKADDEYRRAMPAPERSIGGLRELIDLWGSDEVIRLEVLDESWVRAATIRVQAEHSTGLAKSIILLDANGMFIQCAPLTRMIWESAITGLWAALTPRSGHALVAEGDYSKALLKQSFSKMVGEKEERIGDMVGEWKDWRTNETKYIKQRAKALDGDRWLYAYYRFLSGYSHGDGSLLAAYVEEGDEHLFGHGWRWKSTAEFEARDMVLALAVIGLLYTMLAWDEVTADHPTKDALVKFGLKNGLAVNLDDLKAHRNQQAKNKN